MEVHGPVKLLPMYHIKVIIAQCSLADIVTVTLENNAALTGQTGGGLIGSLVWLRGWTVIIRTHKSHAFSQIIPGLKAPIVAAGWCAAVWAPPQGQQCHHSRPLTATDGQFQVWIGCVASGLY